MKNTMSTISQEHQSNKYNRKHSLMQTNLIPSVQQHDIVLIQVILRELGHLVHTELARLVRALKKARSVRWRRLLEPGGCEWYLSM